jgi:hypothetical protein
MPEEISPTKINRARRNAKKKIIDKGKNAKYTEQVSQNPERR